MAHLDHDAPDYRALYEGLVDALLAATRSSSSGDEEGPWAAVNMGAVKPFMMAAVSRDGRDLQKKKERFAMSETDPY